MAEPSLSERMERAAAGYATRWLSTHLEADLRWTNPKCGLPKPRVGVRVDTDGFADRLHLCARVAREESLPEQERVRIACEILEAPIA